MSDLLAGPAAQWVAAASAGRTWPMLFVKQALAGLPRDEAFAQFTAALRRPAGASLTWRPLLSARDHAERGAAIFRELEPAGEPFVNQPPRVIGEGDQRLLAHRKRSVYVAAFDQVSVRGRSQLVETSDSLLLDYEGGELARVDDEIELDSAIFRREESGAWIIEEPSTDTLRVDECFSLLGPNSFAFGHWLAEYLPRLWLALESGLMPAVAILIDQGMGRQHRQSLESLLPAGTRIIEVKPMQKVEVGRLWFAPTYFYAPVYPQFNQRFRYELVASPPDRFQRIVNGMLARMAPAVAREGDDRLYLARKPGGHRQLVNHAAIEAIAVRAGFKCVYLEDHDFIEQLHMVGKAKYLLGPEGSAFFLGFFARPGTRACILNHPHTEYLTTVTALLDAIAVECTVLTGPFERVEAGDYLHHSDYSIDPEVFSEFLRQWCAD
jgi:hypothetical protein